MNFNSTPPLKLEYELSMDKYQFSSLYMDGITYSCHKPGVIDI